MIDAYTQRFMCILKDSYVYLKIHASNPNGAPMVRRFAKTIRNPRSAGSPPRPAAGDAMKYRIECQTRHRIRIRLFTTRLSAEETKILEYAFSGIPGVTGVTVYRPTAGCALEYDCSQDEILRRLDRFRFENVEMLAKEEDSRINAEEMRARKLDPKLKRRLRTRILLETVADLALPAPVQIGYHAWQMLTLKNL